MEPGKLHDLTTGCEIYGADSEPLTWIPLLSPSETYDPLAFNEVTDRRIGGTLLIVSGHMGVNPLEIVDFTLGFAGLDIAGDDLEPSQETIPPKATTALTGIND